ncbi:MAG TPA: hypothetical protein VK631_23905 [Solirubrobacteraceae bacterium]|nr:hypothetical protein [Solirubrobacteraceae bacterium]
MSLGIIVAWAVLTTACALPTSAAGTNARPVGQLPDSAGQRLRIEAVSTDGAHILLTKAGSSPGESLWALDTMTGTSRQLAPLAVAGRYGQSPAGDWAAWATRSGARSCAAGRVDVARTDGSEPPRTLALPRAYARSYVNGVTIGAGGRVTVRVGRCDEGREPGGSDNRAILTADPGSARLRVLARSRSSFSQWPVSQDGRVFALCRRAKTAGGRAGAELTVVDSDPVLKVSSARLASNDEQLWPACVASDAGTATMTVIRRRPGAPARTLRDYRIAGVTVGGGRSPSFMLPYGVAIPNSGLEAASPSGHEVVTGYFDTTAIVIQTRTGRHSRPYRTPTDGFTGTSAFGGRYVGGQPLLAWDPFAPAIVSLGTQGIQRAYRVRVFNPHSLKSSRPTNVPGDPLHDYSSVCFLPSGRVLFEVRRDGGTAPSQLLVSDAQRSRFTKLDAGRVGTVSSVSCDAAAAGKVFAATAGSGLVYEVAANTIDGSPLQ